MGYEENCRILFDIVSTKYNWNDAIGIKKNRNKLLSIERERRGKQETRRYMGRIFL